MTTNRLPRIVRAQARREPPTFLELFFDLVFIFTFRRLAEGLVEHFTPVGVARTAVLLLATWWIWELMVWLTDLYEPGLPQIQMLIIMAMLGSLVLALVVPDAFDGRRWIFATAYLAIVFTRSSVLIAGTRRHPLQTRSLRVAFWFCLSSGPWIAGGLTHNARVQLALWSLAVFVDYLAARIGWPTPFIGRTNQLSRIFTGEHVSERHRQIFIIGLGEVILSSGLKFTGSRFGVSAWFALVSAFATALLLFLIYARQSRRLLAPPALWSMDRVGPGITTAYSHLIMVAGVVVLSAGDAFIARDPFGRLSLARAMATVTGPALFLFGSAVFERAVTGRILWSRPIAIAAMFAIGPAIGLLPAVVLVIAQDLVLVGAFVSDVTLPSLKTVARARYPA
jgi:low temperature requirement protein LtrA